jgi:hypothetical protein
MELLEGESLHDRIRRGPLPPWHAAELCRQAAQVLAIAHKEGIVHRDLKPENLFLVPDDDLRGKLRVKVLDFGVAKLTGTLALDKTLGTAGSPPYMSPEQWLAAPTIDGRADIYALGCVAFEMLTGAPPFAGSNLPEFVTAHLHGPIPSVRAKRPEVPEQIDALLTRMLAKQPDDRPPAMTDIAKAFEAFAQEPGASASSPELTMQGYVPNAATGKESAKPVPVAAAQVSAAQVAPTERPAPPIFDAFPSGRRAEPAAPRVAALGSVPAADGETVEVRPRLGVRSTGWMIALSALALAMLVVIVYVVVDHARRTDDKPSEDPFRKLNELMARENTWRLPRELPQGPRMTSYQITVAQYATYLHAIREERGLRGQPDLDLSVAADRLPNASKPIATVKIEHARGFCEAIGGMLPPEPAWKTAAPRGAIENANGTFGPLREWVDTPQDETSTRQCGTDRTGDLDDKNTYQHACGPGEWSEHVGFRCAKNN